MEIGSGLGRDAEYDMVLADAVLLHFTPTEAEMVARKIFNALKPNGIFALRMKEGNGPAWSEEKLGEPRYFYYWPETNLKELLSSCGFDLISLTKSYTKHNSANWMHIILQRD